MPPAIIKKSDRQGYVNPDGRPRFSTKYKIRTYDPIRVKDVLYH